MSTPVVRSPGGAPDYMAAAFEHLVLASSPAEAFGSLSGCLLQWLACSLVVVQVKVGASEPLLFQGGGAVTIPGIGVAWRTGSTPQADALARGELVVHDDLVVAFSFGEDASLSRAGLRSAVRGALLAGGREIGRVGLFATEPAHFTPERVQTLRELLPALRWLCRQAAYSAHLTIDTDIGAMMDELVTAAAGGLYSALRTCRNHLSRLVPAAGVLAVLEAPSTRPVVLTDQVGVTLPGVPESGDPTAWRHWLQHLPPDGQMEPVAWILPIHGDGGPVGALAFAFPQVLESPFLWQRRLRPVIGLLALLVETERARHRARLAARSQVGALASGLADEIGNLMTELALQADLLGAGLPDQPGLRRRRDALMRLVEKGTGLSARLGLIAATHHDAETWQPLAKVAERTARALGSYDGARQIRLEHRLNGTGDLLVEAGLVEHALTQLVLGMVQHRGAAAEIRLCSRPSADLPDHVLLWLSDSPEEEPPAFAASPRNDLLEIPARTGP